MATVTSSVTVIPGPLSDAAALDARIEELRRRFPRALIDRYLELIPSVGRDVLIAPGAAVIGGVELGDDVSIWYGAVLRGDLAPVVIGAGSNIQDGCVLHVGDNSPCIIGRDVVVGHGAIVHACRVEDACLIGMHATVLDDAVIGQGSVIGTFLGVLIQGLIQTYITFDGTLSSWWTKIVTGILLFAFIALQQSMIAIARRSALGKAGATA